MSLLSPQLQAFLAIAKRHTVHAAAEDLYLTQTAVTQRIKSLEKSLNTTLFIRTRRGMLLTPEGEALLRYCQANKTIEAEALSIIQHAGSEREVHLSISAPTSIMHARIIPACVPIMKSFPNLLLEFIVDDCNDHANKLRSTQTDLAIVQKEQLSAEIQYKTLQPEEYVLVACKQWKKRSLKEIIKKERIIDFDVNDQITLNYLKKYKLANLTHTGRYFVNRTDDLAKLTIEGIGYTTLAKEFAEPYLKSGQLITLHEGKALKLTPYLAWFDRPTPPSYFRAVIDAIW